jgi:hypothetical protein
MRNAKTLGLALLAMLSMSAVTAMSASADTLTAGGYPAVLTGAVDEGFKDTFTTTYGAVSCPEPKYDATITGPVTTAGSVSVTPTYPHVGCLSNGVPMTIDMNGCTYQFKALASTNGTVNLVCPAEKEVTVTVTAAGVLKCTLHVKPQTDIKGTIKYTNVAGGVTVNASLKEIHYTHTQGIGIGSCPSGTGTNGLLVAKAVISAETHAGGALSLALS